MDLDSWSKQDLQKLAQVSDIGHPARIAILLGLKNNEAMTSIAGFLDITRPSLQDHVDKLVDSELIYRPSEKDRAYSLTPLGEYFAVRLREDADLVIQVFEELERAEAEVREEKGFTEAELENTDLPVNEGEVERTVHTGKWEKAIDDVKELIEEQ